MDKQQHISIEVCRSFEGLDYIRVEWDALVEEATSSIFQTYDWCRIWWKYYGVNRKLFILLFRRNGRLVGALPLFAEKVRLGGISLRIVKVLSSDHTYATIWPAIQEPYIAEAFKLAIRQMIEIYHWDVFLLDCLPGIFEAKTEQLKLAIQQELPDGFIIKQGKTVEQTYFELPGTYEQYIESFDKKKQHELRRKKRIFDEVVGSPDKLTSRMIPVEQTVEGFDAFYHAHQKHWQQMNRSGHFGDWPNSREFHADIAKTLALSGKLRLLEVRCDGEPVGYKYTYRCGKVLIEFLDARVDEKRFERATLGSLIFLEQVKWACQEGVKFIDSQTGRFEHKLQMGGKLLPSRTFLICRNNSLGRIKLFRKLATFINLFYYKLWFCRICPRYNIRRGNLWKVWIRSHMLVE